MTKREFLESKGYRKSAETIYYKYTEDKDCCEKIIDELQEVYNLAKKDFEEMMKYEDGEL